MRQTLRTSMHKPPHGAARLLVPPQVSRPPKIQVNNRDKLQLPLGHSKARQPRPLRDFLHA